jgi:hypothetical protein
MLDNEWRTLVSRDEPGFIRVCLLDSELVAHLQAKTETVRIYRSAIDKILGKHRFSHEDLSIIKPSIERGIAICDREMHITFFYKHSSCQYFQTSIKITKKLDEVIVCTCHKIRFKDFERKMRQLKDKPLLRPHK